MFAQSNTTAGFATQLAENIVENNFNTAEVSVVSVHYG